MEVLEKTAVSCDTASPSAFFETLYPSGLRSAARFVSQQGGTLEDAKDLLHDALIILHERTGRDNTIKNVEQYLIGIIKNLWYKKVKHDSNFVDLDDYHATEELPAPTPHEEKLLSLLERTGKACMDLLSAFYFAGISMAAIKKTFGFSSEHSAAVQKYKCIEKLRNTVKEKSLDHEDFLA